MIELKFAMLLLVLTKYRRGDNLSCHRADTLLALALAYINPNYSFATADNQENVEC